MKAIEHAAKAATVAAESLAKVQRAAATLTAFIPFIPGEPRNVIPTAVYGGAAIMVCYKLRTIADAVALIESLPPVACAAFEGTFAGVRPSDTPERGNNTLTPCDGVTMNVDKCATTGAYPCDQHAMSLKWWTDTPAGRMFVDVDFCHNVFTSWPTIWTHYAPRYDRQGRQTGDSVKLERWGCSNPPADAKSFRYGSGEPDRTPGNYLFYFTDAAHRDNVLAGMETYHGEE